MVYCLNCRISVTITSIFHNPLSFPASSLLRCAQRTLSPCHFIENKIYFCPEYHLFKSSSDVPSQHDFTGFNCCRKVWILISLDFVIKLIKKTNTTRFILTTFRRFVSLPDDDIGRCRNVVKMNLVAFVFLIKVRILLKYFFPFNLRPKKDVLPGISAWTYANLKGINFIRKEVVFGNICVNRFFS